MQTTLTLQKLGRQDYQRTWQQMRDLTDTRDANTPDEIWFLEHPPVFTQGQAGKAEHVLAPGDIPVIQTDRGGQVTYHGPGQWVVYFMIDLRRLGIGIRKMVTILEDSVVDTLAEYGITAAARPDAPGVYVDGAKICSIGLRVRRGCSYHGIAFNVDMDIEPFQRINPCGFQQLKIVQIRDFVPDVTLEQVRQRLIPHLCRHFGYNGAINHLTAESV